MNADIKHLISFRQSLHQNPELSGYEEYTAEALKRTIIKFQPDEIIDNLGGYGVAFVFKGEGEGPTVLFRADMDALPINEINNLDYASRLSGVSHQCGHDGHMAIMVGVAEQISQNRPRKGKIVLLFQPAEETGEGAMAVLNDPNFSRIMPDLCFALHNVPGYPEGSIVVRQQIFSAASVGLIVKLDGKTSHAAEPEKGINPVKAMIEIIQNATNGNRNKNLYKDYVLTTVVHARLGERSFGTNPGHAELLLTLRAYNNEDMELLASNTENDILTICKKERLACKVTQTDVFPTTENNPALVKMVSELAKNKGMKVIAPLVPFPWAEDFSRFTHKFKSAFFGLGAGENHPKLHNSDYNFPDEIIPDGIKILTSIYEELLNT